jgi:hypothetical protein
LARQQGTGKGAREQTGVCLLSTLLCPRLLRGFCTRLRFDLGFLGFNQLGTDFRRDFLSRGFRVGGRELPIDRLEIGDQAAELPRAGHIRQLVTKLGRARIRLGVRGLTLRDRSLRQGREIVSQRRLDAQAAGGGRQGYLRILARGSDRFPAIGALPFRDNRCAHGGHDVVTGDGLASGFDRGPGQEGLPFYADCHSML